MSAEPDPVARVVKPRSIQHSLLHVIALTRRRILLERTGETFNIDQLPAVIVAEPSSMIVAEEMGKHILTLHEIFKDSKTFQYKLTPVYRDVIPTNGETKRRAVLRDTTTSLVGFPGHYHHPVDPLSFVRVSISDIDKRHIAKILKLLEWGQEVRNFCLLNDMPAKPSAGGIAAQLLRDPRFYPKARRKVPKLINRKGREKLPGNYYKLHTETHLRHRASYLDMQGAHHYIAATLNFPCANDLHAHGAFKSEQNVSWAKPNTDRFTKALQCPGLFLVRLAVPHLPPNSFALPYMIEQGERNVWVFSNELASITALGGRIEGIHAAIISTETDTGLNKYAKYALGELDKKPDQAGWLKPVLHSVYGVLATRPRPMEFGWRLVNGGTEDEYPMGGKVVPVKVVKTTHEIEAKAVNAIHRGMIEAEQRLKALTLARELHSMGAQILCIYADSLFVRMDQLPLLPPPWRLKKQVTGLRFLSATQFMSPQITRLPGVPHGLRDSFGQGHRALQKSRNLRGPVTRSA